MVIYDYVRSFFARICGLNERKLEAAELISSVETSGDLREAAQKEAARGNHAGAAVLFDAANRLEAEAGLITALPAVTRRAATEPAPALPAPKPVAQLPGKRGPGRPRKIELPPTGCHDSSSNGQA